MPVLVKVTQNNNEKTAAFGKWYGRVVSTKTMTYQELCKHMSEHNSVYGEDVCLGANIQGLYLCFAPSRTDVNNLSSKMLKKKAAFMNIKDLIETSKKSSGSSESGNGSNSGTSGTGGDSNGGSNGGNTGTLTPNSGDNNGNSNGGATGGGDGGLN